MVTPRLLPGIVKVMLDASPSPFTEHGFNASPGIGTRPFDIKGGMGITTTLVNWSDSSRQGIHPGSKLDGIWHASSNGSWNES